MLTILWYHIQAFVLRHVLALSTRFTPAYCLLIVLTPCLRKHHSLFFRAKPMYYNPVLLQLVNKICLNYRLTDAHIFINHFCIIYSETVECQTSVIGNVIDLYVKQRRLKENKMITHTNLIIWNAWGDYCVAYLYPIQSECHITWVFTYNTMTTCVPHTV